MASTMRRNSLPGTLSRGMAQQNLEFWIPPEDSDGITQLQNPVVGPILINGAMVRNLITNGYGVLPRPASPMVTFASSTDRIKIFMTGLNQWGEKISALIVKDADGTVQKVLVASTAATRIPAFSRIDTVDVVEVTVGAGQFSIGFNYGTGSGNAMTIALPIRLSTADILTQPTATRSVYIAELDGLWTAGTWPNFATVTTPAGDTVNAQQGTISVTTGTTQGISQSASTFTNATRNLLKTNAFTNYTWRPGDTVTIVSGTGVAPGSYVVAYKVDASNIVLETDIGGANPVDVVFTLVQTPVKWGRGFILMNPDFLNLQ